MSKKGKNIIHDDEKREKKGSFLKFLLIFLTIPLIATAGYFFYTNSNNPDEINKNNLDPRFEVLNLKNLIDFEKPTMNQNYYKNNKTFLGYFYSANKFSVDKLSPAVIIISTIDRMFNCVKINEGKDACGIKAINFGYQVPANEVIKYAQLLYGDEISIKHQSIEFPYGSIYNLKFVDNYYTFSQTKDVMSSDINTYVSIEDSLIQDNNQAILTKYVLYIEANIVNGQLNGYSAYKTHNKFNLLFSNENKTKNMNEILIDIEKQIKDIELPKYKIIFDKIANGSFTFRQIETIN